METAQTEGKHAVHEQRASSTRREEEAADARATINNDSKSSGHRNDRNANKASAQHERDEAEETSTYKR